MKDLKLIPLTESLWSDVARIYEAGIATKNATFETQAPDWLSWDRAHRKDCRFMAVLDGQPVGWAVLSNVSARCVYAGVAEVSIYVDPAAQGQGVGNRLMSAIIESSEAAGIWTLQAGIFPENGASLHLHRKHGFRCIGIKERIGKMEGQWRDVAMLERRSKVVGID